jgi:hypothetical protein
MLMNGLATLPICCISECAPMGSDCCGIYAGAPHWCLSTAGLCTPCPSGLVCRDTSGTIIDLTCCPNHICNTITTTSSTTSTTSSPSQASNAPSISYTALPPVTVTTRIIETNTVSVEGTQPPQITITATPTPLTSEVDVPFTISYTTVYLTDGSTYSITPAVSSSSSVVVIQVPPTTTDSTASSATNQIIPTGTGGKVIPLTTKIGIGVGVSLGVIILSTLICLLIPRSKRPTWLGGDPPAPIDPMPIFVAPDSGARSPEMEYFGYSPEPIHTGPPLNAGAYGYNQGMQPSLPEMGGYTYSQDPMPAERPIGTRSYRHRRDPILPTGRGLGNQRVSELD